MDGASICVLVDLASGEVEVVVNIEVLEVLENLREGGAVLGNWTPAE